jgi:mannose-1-phosphate guanylyltransferase
MTDLPNTFAVVMAGGIGSRFWPKSRKALPKQFLALLDKETLIQATCHRLQVWLPPESIYVVATANHALRVKEQLPWLKPQNILHEPFGKNTAPCIGLAAMHLLHVSPDAVMIVLPADHHISRTDRFIKALQSAVTLVQQQPEALVTIGIDPTYPATGYGYIQRGEAFAFDHNQAFKVRAFAEKPTLEVAAQFFSSGEFLWNSGIFIWRCQAILNNIEQLMPDLYAGLMEIDQAIGKAHYDDVVERVYKQIHSDSIDYGVMEQASNVLVLEGDFGWSDVGSWDEVYNRSQKNPEGNVVLGEPILKDVSNCYIESGQRVIVVLGVNDLVIVDTDDALLICNRNKTQDVKWVVEKLKHNEKLKYL